MGIKTREVITPNGKKAIQIVHYANNRRKILEHVGTANSQEELTELKTIAQKRIKSLGMQISFNTPSKGPEELFKQNYTIVGTRLSQIYNTLTQIYKQIGFNKIDSTLLRDLAIVRIVNPTSKRQSIELIEEKFGIKYSIDTVYKNFKHLQRYKKEVEKATLKYATRKLKQNIKILFYDVTTLYFESFTPDELKKMGFSKDNKFNQPQIVIGLVTTTIGFPITYQLFSGNKFEGHSMLPIIKGLTQRHKVKTMTVVADAAMISKDNVRNLVQEGFSFIVGARLGNLQQKYLKKIYKLNKKKDQQLFEITTNLGRLIVQFSQTRYRKDRYELKKARERAETILKMPSKISRRYKYVSKSKSNKYELNEALLEKREKELGLKGYYTNTTLKAEEVIEQYKNLWKIEQNFRVLKSDMKVRPIYHWKASSIQSHLLVCFVSLCLSKLIEIKTGISVKEFTRQLMKIVDTVVIDKASETKFLVPNTVVNGGIQGILDKLSTK